MVLTWAPGIAMSKEEMDSFLNQKLLARLATNRSDGYPHATPLYYIWDGEAIWFILDTRERPRQHIRNLRRDPKLCLVIDSDRRPEQGGIFDAQGVTIRGTAELFTDDNLTRDLLPKVTRKYFGEEADQYAQALLEDGSQRVIVKVKPEKLYAWDFRKLEGSGGHSST